MTATKQEMGQTLSQEQEEMAFEGIADMLSNVLQLDELKIDRWAIPQPKDNECPLAFHSTWLRSSFNDDILFSKMKFHQQDNTPFKTVFYS